MTSKKLELRVPNELLSILGKTPKLAERAAMQHLVLSMIHGNQISASLGAEALDISYRELLKLMADHNISLISYTDSELKEELKALEKLPL